MLDILIAGVLIVVVPGVLAWRNRRDRDETRIRRYCRTIALATCLVAIVAIDWWVYDRPIDALGLAVPTSPAAMIGLAIAVVLVVLLAIVVEVRGVSETPSESAALLPQTTAERRLFVAFAIAVGLGWEILYRGYLIWFLEPRIGTLAAVIVSAGGYAVAHGIRQWRRFLASLAAALLFTIGYVLTRNLWWLAVIHTALPLIGLRAQSRAAPKASTRSPVPPRRGFPPA